MFNNTFGFSNIDQILTKNKVKFLKFTINSELGEFLLSNILVNFLISLKWKTFFSQLNVDKFDNSLKREIYDTAILKTGFRQTTQA